MIYPEEKDLGRFVVVKRDGRIGMLTRMPSRARRVQVAFGTSGPLLSFKPHRLRWATEREVNSDPWVQGVGHTEVYGATP
jgi:hypothetical protein